MKIHCYFCCILLTLLVQLTTPLFGATWTQRPQSIPRPTGYPAGYTWNTNYMPLVYDEKRGVTVAFGGLTDPPLIYFPISEFNGTEWVSRADLGATSPPDRYPGAVVYDSTRGVTLVIGGYSGVQLLREIWEYNGSSWFKRVWTGPAPADMGYLQACFDPVRGRVICLVRRELFSDNAYETWEWTGTAWEQGPNLLQIHGNSAEIVFDTARNKAFVYGLGTSGFYEQAWEYTPGTTAAQGTWEYLTTNNVPYQGRKNASLVYHPRLKRIFRIGGSFVTTLYSHANDTHIWDSVRQRWVQLFADGSFPESARRGSASSCYDSGRGVIQIYGGSRVDQDGTFVGYNDLWEWNDANPPDTWVDFAYTGSGDGSFERPWKTLHNGIFLAPVGGTVYIKAGKSLESIDSTTLRIMPVTIKTYNGPSTIGGP